MVKNKKKPEEAQFMLKIDQDTWDKFKIAVIKKKKPSAQALLGDLVREVADEDNTTKC